MSGVKLRLLIGAQQTPAPLPEERLTMLPVVYGPPGSGGGGGGVSDGDKGDIVVSGGGSAWAFDSAVVTAFARTFLDDANAGAVRATLGAEATIAAGTTAQYWRGDKSWQTLDKAAVGLGNADNTADSAKSVASAATLTTPRTINGVSFNGSANITINAVDATARAPETRTISTTAPLTGGGDLSANRTLAISAATTGAAGSMSASDKTKLDGIATGATANDTDANLKARANHTGTQTASTISDFSESVDDRVAALLVQGANVTLTYNDAANTLTIAASGGGGGGLSDGDYGDITVSGGSTVLTVDNDVVTNAKLANVATATIKGRATAGTGDPEDLSASQVRTLINVADGATANDTDANLKARANHTGTQAASTITGLATVATSGSASDLGAGTLPIARIADGAVTNAKLADMATARLKGRTTAGTGVPEDLTAAQATALLDDFTSSLKGLAPASGGGTSNFLRADGTWAAPSGGGAGDPSVVETFDSSATWTKPAGAVFVEIYCIAGGAGGGSGRKGAAAAARFGGGAGAGGAASFVALPAALLGATETVTIGTGGAGGTAQATNSTNGNAGTAGGTTSFGSWCQAGGNGAGAGGTNSAGGGGANSGGQFVGGGGGSAGAAGGAGGAGSRSLSGGGGGGGGGGITTGNAASAGGTGGGRPAPVAGTTGTGGGGSSGAINTAGGSGGAALGSGNTNGGAGGGGGGSSLTGNGGTGGAGQAPGGGGGGGGAAVDATGNSGAGGDGAAGRCVVITYF